MEILLLIYIALQLADGYATYRILSAGGRELNPVVDWLILKTDIVTGVGMVKMAAVAGGGVLFFLQQETLLFLLIALYSVVVILNLKQMRKA